MEVVKLNKIINDDYLPYSIEEIEERLLDSATEEVETLTKDKIREFCSNPIFDLSKEEQQQWNQIFRVASGNTYYIPAEISGNYAFAESVDNELDQDFPEPKNN